MGTFIAMAGGGTGGHVFPALAIATELRRRDAGREILFLGSTKGLETRLVPASGFQLEALPLGGLAGMPARRKLAAALGAARAVVTCLGLFRRRRPAIVIGVGGYASGPAVLAALLLRVPTLIHEQNRALGMTNRWLAPFVDAIALSFPGPESAPGGKRTLTGNPVRAEFFAIPPYPGAGERMRVLISGGSRGARTLNQAAIDAAEELSALGSRLSIVHQTGEADHARTAAAYARHGIEAKVLPFFDDMPSRLAWADLAITRAGAGTVFELAAAGRASILVPYPFAAAGHQEQNAAWMASAGAAIVVSDAGFDGKALGRLIREALEAPVSLASRARAARALARPDAAATIASIAERLMQERG